ncbi:MAG: TSUP family transporter [Pseudomonadales bacterium]
MEFSFGIEILILLFFTALAAGLVDTLAGGGGLISLPVLLLVQVPPIQALATNKLQGAFGTFTAAATMLKKRMVRWRDIRVAFAMSLLGASLGTLLVQQIDTQTLELVIPVLMFALGTYLLFNKGAGAQETKAKISARAHKYIVVPIIGFYDGFWGPGAGSFFTVTSIYFRGKQLIAATAETKLLNFASNVASLVVFIWAGQAIWEIGLVMIAGQIAGAMLGSRIIVKGNISFIRPVIIFICFAVAIRYTLPLL